MAKCYFQIMQAAMETASTCCIDWSWLVRLCIREIKVSAEESVLGLRGATEFQSAVISLLISLWSHFPANADSVCRWRIKSDRESRGANTSTDKKKKRKLERNVSQASCDTAAASHLLAFYCFIFIFAFLFSSPSVTSELCHDLTKILKKGR